MSLTCFLVAYMWCCEGHVFGLSTKPGTAHKLLEGYSRAFCFVFVIILSSWPSETVFLFSGTWTLQQNISEEEVHKTHTHTSEVSALAFCLRGISHFHFTRRKTQPHVFVRSAFQLQADQNTFSPTRHLVRVYRVLFNGKKDLQWVSETCRDKTESV